MQQQQGPSPALFFEAANAFQRTEALRAAIELDLFTHIASGHHAADRLAAACGASERGVRILADYLVIAGFLRKSDGRYELTSDSQVFLTRSSPAYLGGALEFLLTPQLRECFTRLTDAVRRGGTAASDEGTVSHDNPIWVAFARAMGPMMTPQAELLVGLVGGDRRRKACVIRGRQPKVCRLGWAPVNEPSRLQRCRQFGSCVSNVRQPWGESFRRSPSPAGITASSLHGDGARRARSASRVARAMFRASNFLKSAFKYGAAAFSLCGREISLSARPKGLLRRTG
jgi:hypothetical protein